VIQRVVAGVDLGSTAIKLGLYDGAKFGFWHGPAGWDARKASLAMLEAAAHEWGVALAEIKHVCGTGYGRVGFASSTRTVAEITCHAKGAAFLCPEVRTVIDIGGQDAKAIRTEHKGHVADFIMNDKCAAGTGRFLQVMAHALELDITDMAHMQPIPPEEVCSINAMCAVFAESEVIGLLNRGESRSSIVAGLYKSIASRIASMADRISPEAPIVLTGGVALHGLLQDELSKALKIPVTVPANAIYAGAIGAALFAWEDYSRGK
jgi:(R)-2-hydroxyacyl-CoA dehydratese activating ATPase